MLQKNLWTKEIKRRYEDKTHWATLKVKKNKGQDYFDILIGPKGKKAHSHLGINLDQTLRFQEGRKLVYSIGRKVESRKKGLVEDKKVVVDKDVTSRRELIFVLIMDGSTGEVKIKKFGLS